jgi:hypothetical protein
MIAKGNELLARHRAYVNEHFEDLPEVRDWVWTDCARKTEKNSTRRREAAKSRKRKGKPGRR